MVVVICQLVCEEQVAGLDQHDLLAKVVDGKVVYRKVVYRKVVVVNY